MRLWKNVIGLATGPPFYGVNPYHMKAYLIAAALLLPVSAYAQGAVFQKQLLLSPAEAALRAPPPADPGPLIEALRWQVLQASNAERADVGLPPLTADPVLDAAAARYSEKMRDYQFFGHVAPDGETLDARLPQDEMWRFTGLAENLWSGQGALDWRSDSISIQAAENWVESPGHRENLFNSAYSVAGVGTAVSGDQIYITMLYATPEADMEQAILKRDYGEAPADLGGFASALEQSLKVALNDQRAQNGLSALSEIPILASTARRHSQSALSSGGFPTGVLDEVFRVEPSRSGRLAAGFWRGSGVVVWQAEAAAKTIVDQWLTGRTGSDALDPDFAQVGFGVASDGDTVQVTVVFGEAKKATFF